MACNRSLSKLSVLFMIPTRKKFKCTDPMQFLVYICLHNSCIVSHTGSRVTKKKKTRIFTSSPFVARFLPDQNKCEHTDTPLHWSGFLSSLDVARAHCVLSGSWLSALKQDICSTDAIIKVIAAS